MGGLGLMQVSRLIAAVAPLGGALLACGLATAAPVFEDSAETIAIIEATTPYLDRSAADAQRRQALSFPQQAPAERDSTGGAAYTTEAGPSLGLQEPLGDPVISPVRSRPSNGRRARSKSGRGGGTAPNDFALAQPLWSAGAAELGWITSGPGSVPEQNALLALLFPNQDLPTGDAIGPLSEADREGSRVIALINARRAELGEEKFDVADTFRIDELLGFSGEDVERALRLARLVARDKPLETLAATSAAPVFVSSQVVRPRQSKAPRSTERKVRKNPSRSSGSEPMTLRQFLNQFFGDSEFFFYLALSILALWIVLRVTLRTSD